MRLPDKTTLKEIWAEVPPDYYFNLNYLQKLWHEWKWLVIRHLVTRQAKTGMRLKILEVGCAGGHLTGLLGSLFPKAKITGIDAYGRAVAEARKRYPRHVFKVADAHQLPFADRSFDLVVCSETIEHVAAPEKMLREIERVLKKDGEALIEMDSGSWLFRLVWFGWTRFGRGKVWSRAHLHPFTAAELESLIGTNGFAIREKMFSHFGMAVSFLVTSGKNRKSH